MDKINTVSEVDENGNVSMGTLYELNQQAYAKVLPLNIGDTEKYMQQIRLWAIQENNKYYMLLCHERRDYTVFRTNPSTVDKMINELQLVIKNRGYLLDVEKIEGAFQIWVRDKFTKENYMFMLFPANDFVLDVIDDE